MAIREYEKACALNPNDAHIVTEYGWGLGLSGRPDEGILLMENALLLNPYYPGWYMQNLAYSYFAAQRYDEPVAALERITQPFPALYRSLAVNYALLGQMESARSALAKYVELEPEASVELVAQTMPFKREEDLERYLDGLRKAGLPEKSPTPGT